MKKLWQETLTHLEKTLNAQHFNTWIKPIRLVAIEKDLVRIEVPNRFVLDWVRDHYADIIRETMSSIGAVSYHISIEIIQKNKEPKAIDKKDIEVRQTPISIADSKEYSIKSWNSAFNINPRYTFEEFVAGSSNQFAVAAAMAGGKQSPPTSYTPFFLRGGGTRKTHIL